MTEEKSLKVIKEGLFDRIRNFINRIFRRQQILEAIEEQEMQEEVVEDSNEQISLEERIEKENINLSEEDNDNIENVNEDLSRYLEKIQKEINKVKDERIERNLNEYHEEFALYREKMAN